MQNFKFLSFFLMWGDHQLGGGQLVVWMVRDHICIFQSYMSTKVSLTFLFLEPLAMILLYSQWRSYPRWVNSIASIIPFPDWPASPRRAVRLEELRTQSFCGYILCWIGHANGWRRLDVCDADRDGTHRLTGFRRSVINALPSEWYRPYGQNRSPQHREICSSGHLACSIQCSDIKPGEQIVASSW